MKNKSLQAFELFKYSDKVLVSNLLPNLNPLHVESGSIIYRRKDKADESSLHKI